MLIKIGIPVILFIILNLIIFIYNKLCIIKAFNIKFDESIKNITILQEKEINLLTKLGKKLNEKTDEKILKDLPKIKNKNYSVFELHNKLTKFNKEINDLIIEGSTKLSNEEKSLLNLLKNNSLELKAVEQYYNNEAEKYNKIRKKIKYLFIRIIKRLKKVETFYFEKIVDFEILKEN